jgi:hypothetical protein
MVTLKEQVAVRFNESVAVQLTVVVPIGKLAPDPGEQLTLTGLCPPDAGGASKSSVIPAALTVEREMPSTHASVGGAATGGGGGTGVGAVGVLLHAAVIATTIVATAKPERIAQDVTNLMDMN